LNADFIKEEVCKENVRKSIIYEIQNSLFYKLTKLWKVCGTMKEGAIAGERQTEKAKVDGECENI